MAKNSEPPIIEMSEYKESVNLLVYGNSGVGKTPWAATVPGSLIVAADNGTISAARAGSKAKVWPIKDWSDFEEAQKWLRAGGAGQFPLVVLDGLTMLREKCMRFVLDREHERNGARDLFIPAQPDHQAVQNMIKYTVEKFCDLPVHTVFTALPMHVESRSGDEVVVPLVHGQKGDLSHYVAGLMDAYGYMERTENDKGRSVARIHWAPYNEYTGKDRFGVLAPYTDNVDLPEILERIEGSGSPEARATARSRSTRTAARRPAARRRRTA